jgi:hypothetical protein
VASLEERGEDLRGSFVESINTTITAVLRLARGMRE